MSSGAKLLAIVAGITAADAATIRVPRDYGKIQQAIDAARDGDDITVAAGTYHERLDFDGKAIRVMGAGSANTTVDATRVGSVVAGGVVHFRSGETSRSVLSGFTITGGRAVEHGGGICCSNAGGGIESSPIIRDCVIRDNRTTGTTRGGQKIQFGGGGIACWKSSPSIVDCLIESNRSSSAGGGVLCWDASPTIRGATIAKDTGNAFSIYGLVGGSPQIIDL